MEHLKNTVPLKHTDIITKLERNYEWLNQYKVFQVYWVYLLVCHTASTISCIIQWKYLSFTCLGFHFCRMCYLLQYWCDILWVRNSKKETSLTENSLPVNQEDLRQKSSENLCFTYVCQTMPELENPQFQFLEDLPEFWFSVHSILSVLI